jgi:alkanesulfonate monooxygenase SsuD/methylene tetrahydromethanopterin reductase-like flavin-dependent oxidoreductase (luciferase family)
MKFILAGLGNCYSNWNLIENAIIKANEGGFWAALLPDHYMVSEGEENSTLDTWTIISHLASKTDRIRLGTLVTPIPLRPPGILAKIVSTVDVISGGRAILGVGAGWSQSEFEAFSEWNDAKTRVDKTEEGLTLIIRLWTEKSVNFAGKYYRTRNAVLEPKTIQKPHPPLLIGGMGAGTRMLKVAGKYSDMCFIPMSKMKTFTFEQAKKIVLEEARKQSREDKISFVGGATYSLPKFPHFGATYDRDSYAKGIEAAKSAGCEYVLIPFPHKTLIEDMEDFVTNVLPLYHC